MRKCKICLKNLDFFEECYKLNNNYMCKDCIETCTLYSMKSIKLLDYLKDVREYIINKEETIECEWGSCRTWRQIYEDGDYPNIFDQTEELIKQEKKK